MGRGVNEELERRIRVFCNDPEATDVSSDEGDDVVSRAKRKKMVVEICLPSPVLAVPSTPRVSRNGTPSTRKVRRVGVAPTKKGGVGGGRPRSSVAAKGSATKMRGVRQRKWGKWAAEIRDPIRRIRLWLGTYDTPEEAAVAYQREAMRLEAEKNAISSSSSTSAAAAAAAVSSTSDNSEGQQPTISSPSSVLDLSKGSGLKMVAEEEAKASPPPPPPLLPPVLPLDMDFGFEVDSFLDNNQLGGGPIPTTFGAFDEFPSSFCIDDGGQEEGSFDDFRLGDVLDFDFDPISSWVDEANPLVSVTTTTSSFADY